MEAEIILETSPAAGARPAQYSEAVWRWMLEENPDGGCLGVARGADGAVLASIVGLRHAALLRGEPACFLEIAHVFNDFDRGGGLDRARAYLALGRAFAERFGGHAPEAHPVMYGIPTRRAHRIGLRHLGYEILRSENKLCVAHDALKMDPDEIVEVEEVERFPESIGGFFRRLAAGREAILVRDADRLNWRYADHPEHRYRIGVARRGGEPCGYVVYRRGTWDESDDGLLCDWLAPTDDWDGAAALLSWAAGCAREDGAARLTCNLPDKSEEWLVFQEFGFRAHGTHEYLVFRSFQRPYIMSWLFANWFTTLGDSLRV